MAFAQTPSKRERAKSCSDAGDRAIVSIGCVLRCASPGIPRRSEHQSGEAGFQTHENGRYINFGALESA
jgi:hypothetical protein